MNTFGFNAAHMLIDHVHDLKSCLWLILQVKYSCHKATVFQYQGKKSDITTTHVTIDHVMPGEKNMWSSGQLFRAC